MTATSLTRLHSPALPVVSGIAAPRSWSLTAKISTASALLCVLCVTVTAVVLGLQSSATAQDAANRQATVAAQEAAAVVAGELGNSFSAVTSFAALLQGMRAGTQPPGRGQLDDMARQLLAQRAEFIGTYSIWEPNALDGRDAEFVNKTASYDGTGRYIAYWNRGAGAIAVEALLDYEKAGANDWYDIPRRTLKSALIEPYSYPIAGQDVLMTTMVAPVLLDGRFVAAAGADIPLQGLSQRMAGLEPVPGGYVSLLSNGGLYVANPQAERLGKPADDLPAQALAQIARGESFQIDDGRGWIHLFAPVQVSAGLSPWSVRVSYPISVAAASAQQLMRNALVAAAIACALAALAMLVMVRTLMRPLRQLGTTMASLASGDADLRVTLPVSGNDELGVIAQGFNGFAAKLRGAFGEVGEVSAGVASASRQIASGNADLSMRTEEQAAHLQQSASALRELSEAVSQSAESSNHAARLAKAAVNHTAEGQRVMQETRSAMDQINESSRRIAEITSLIDSIAFQTNILALNAAVEAARAGDQGRGFAVVAGEVRTLAQRSAAAAKDIRQLTVDSEQRVAAGATLIRQAVTTLEGLGNSVQQVDLLLADISIVSREQSGRIQSVTLAIGELDQNTQQNAAIVEEAAAAADSLQQQSGRLEETMRQFVG